MLFLSVLAWALSHKWPKAGWIFYLNKGGGKIKSGREGGGGGL